MPSHNWRFSWQLDAPFLIVVILAFSWSLRTYLLRGPGVQAGPLKGFVPCAHFFQYRMDSFPSSFEVKAAFLLLCHNPR